MWGCRFFLQRHPGHAKGKFYIVIPDIFYREFILFFPSQQPLIEWNEAHAFILNTMSKRCLVMPEFVPGRRSFAWGVPKAKAQTFVLEAKVDKTNDAQSGLIRCVGRRLRRADQLVALRQGLQIDKSVRPNGRTAGVER